MLEFRAEGMEAAPHISCIGGVAARRSRDVLARYKSHGIRHLVALRGDLPSGAGDAGDFRYASELVAFIREETGDWFHIDVAAYPECHPQARSPQEDLVAFKRKIDAGANSAITQYFYNPDAYWHFVDACRAAGITVPIVPGIMPIGSYTKLARFSDACGAEIPRWIRTKLEGYGDDTASIRAFGLDVVTDLADALLARGAPGLHFYTLNQAALTTTIWQRLGHLTSGAAFAAVSGARRERHELDARCSGCGSSRRCPCRRPSPDTARASPRARRRAPRARTRRCSCIASG